MQTCHLCNAESVDNILDLGKQPICSRYLKTPDAKEYKHPMIMGQCSTCGLIQLLHPVPPEKLIPKYGWISYNEPEGHLDDLVDKISKLPGITKESKIFGISYKDDSTLSRFNIIGFKDTWRLDVQKDLDITDKKANIETIQDRLISDKAIEISETYGKADVVIARHILEHAYDMHTLMDAIKKLLKPNGYIILEVPDCSTSLETKNYTMLWEEHISYFTSEVFRCCFSFFGFSLQSLECYPYPFENSLVGIARFEDTVPSSILSENEIEKQKIIAHSFCDEFEKKRTEIQKSLRRIPGKIALFGAGHLSCTFINLLKLENCIEFIVDDNPNKKGLFMPGSKLNIKGSNALFEKNIKFCLLSLSPESEEKVIINNQLFIDKGGIFSSITPVSKYALDINKLHQEQYNES